MLPIDNTNLPDQWFLSDEHLNALYPDVIQSLASRHWTPLNIAREAANFLATGSGVKILDIGSGVGKFCLTGAYYFPNAQFAGVEQRANLVKYALEANRIISLPNVQFMHANFKDIDITGYNHFYFYNAFYENLIDNDTIDQSVIHSAAHFNSYNLSLFKQLNKMPAGTRLATFHSTENEIPPSYHVVGEGSNKELKFWIKV